MIAQIQARMGSSRLPGKVLLPLGDERILERVVRRSAESELVDDVVVATSTNDENEAITRWCERTGTAYARGPEANLLERHLQTARCFDSETVLRICADCPLVPAWEIDRVVDEHRTSGAEYTTNVVDTVPVGVAVEVVERRVLETLHEEGETHPALPIRDDPDRWKVHEAHSETWEHVGDVDISVDTPADYWELEDAIESVGPDAVEVAEWRRNRG